jgi:hypothetical protein
MFRGTAQPRRVQRFPDRCDCRRHVKSGDESLATSPFRQQPPDYFQRLVWRWRRRNLVYARHVERGRPQIIVVVQHRHIVEFDNDGLSATSRAASNPPISAGKPSGREYSRPRFLCDVPRSCEGNDFAVQRLPQPDSAVGRGPKNNGIKPPPDHHCWSVGTGCHSDEMPGSHSLDARCGERGRESHRRDVAICPYTTSMLVYGENPIGPKVWSCHRSTLCVSECRLSEPGPTAYGVCADQGHSITTLDTRLETKRPPPYSGPSVCVLCTAFRSTLK